MPSFEYDRRYVEWSLGVLESYLLSDQLYWSVETHPPAGESAYPMLTLEGLLLAMHRLLAHQERLSDEAQANKLMLEMETIHSRWRVAWERKASRCYQARLGMWRNYLGEYLDFPDAHADRYRYEVRLRVFLELLAKSTDSVSVYYSELLYKLDGDLKMAFLRGEFIWDENIRSGFPADRFWYLYGNLPSVLPARPTERVETTE